VRGVLSSWETSETKAVFALSRERCSVMSLTARIMPASVLPSLAASASSRFIWAA
jgi:hypothetical protein